MPYQEITKSLESASAVGRTLGLEMQDRLGFFFPRQSSPPILED
jgi:hypothetical protein